jgi:hypothetical protein
VFKRSLVLVTAVTLAAAERGSFSRGLYPVLEKAGCRSCHNPDGVASATRLVFPDRDAEAARVEAFGYSLAPLVDRAKPGESLLVMKPSNRVPHTGGERVQRGSPEEAEFLRWSRVLAAMSSKEIDLAARTGASVRSATPRAVLRRLTHSQYNNTVRDLIGDRTLPASQFPLEDFVNGFRNQYQSMNLSPLQMEAYSSAAERLARHVFRGADPARFGDDFVAAFGLQAFRRPLSADELARYRRLHASEPDRLRAARLVVEAMLQSPAFLFRLDETDKQAWKPYASASRLSYALWDTMPDAELLRAAASGELDTPAEIEKAARRMLQDPRARPALDEFASQWLRFDRMLGAGKDRRIFPQFSRETAAAATEEARRFVAGLVWSGANFMEFYTSDYGYANADLARIYGVEAPKDFDRIRFPESSGRAGILGQTLFLALTSKPADTSPTARGIFVREQFLCQHVPEPPPGVAADLPAVTEDKPRTNRERMAEHQSNPACSNCHNLIDPIGFGFEKFDAAGAYRDKVRILFFPGNLSPDRKAPPKEVLLDVDTSGSVAGIPDSKFTSPKELGRVLASSPVCQECVVKQYFRYVAGRIETVADRPVIRRVFERFRSSGFNFQEMMIAMMKEREQ